MADCSSLLLLQSYSQPSAHFGVRWLQSTWVCRPGRSVPHIPIQIGITRFKPNRVLADPTPLDRIIPTGALLQFDKGLSLAWFSRYVGSGLRTAMFIYTVRAFSRGRARVGVFVKELMVIVADEK